MEVVIAAAIAALASVFVAWISTRSIKGRVGTPNGHGTLIDMVTHLFTEAGEIKGKVDDLKETLQHHTIEDREQFAQVNLRLGNLEHEEVNRPH